jgi:DNA-directed RNA polymerase subunit alpha
MSPREALESAIKIMINQLKAVVGFQEEPLEEAGEQSGSDEGGSESKDGSKMKTEELGLSARVTNALTRSGIRSVGGLIRKSEEDLTDVEGMGAKGITEIKDALDKIGLKLK